MTTTAQREAFDREVRYAIRHDLRAACALLNHGPKALAAPKRFLTYAIRRDDFEAVELLTDLGAPTARVLRKLTGIPPTCMAVLLRKTTPGMLNATEGYFETLWLAIYRNTYHLSFDRTLDRLEAAGADITWAGLERAFGNEDDVAFFKRHLSDPRLAPNTRARLAALRERLDRNSTTH